MLEKVEKTAKNLDEALTLAAKDLGVSKEEVSYTVTREVGKGFMRLLVGSEIDITAWRTADEERENAEKAKAEKKAAEIRAAKNAKATKASKETEAQKPSKEAAPAKKADTDTAKEAEAPERPRKAPIHEVDDDFVIPKTAVDDAKYFVSELLAKIGLKAELHIKLDKNVISIDVSGDKMGLLIGKRGDTLDAVQMLTSLYVNKDKSMPYIKIKIDTENYRAKREDTLVRLAHGLERSVMKDKKSITLEPMTANERRIIHSALQNNPKIKTYSVGEEPNRRMIISLAKPEA